MYYRTVAGNKTLDAISSLIADEEAGASKFVEDKVATVKTAANKQALSNLMKFLELDAPVPPVPILTLVGQPAPAGKSLQWSGPMLVAGNLTMVNLYR